MDMDIRGVWWMYMRVNVGFKEKKSQMKSREKE